LFHSSCGRSVLADCLILTPGYPLKDLSIYALEDYTVIKHVMVNLSH
jgi:hypothetical protein